MKIASLEKVCREYARRLDTKPDIALRESAEWDFREITEEELPLAIRYEYARENAGLRNRLVSLLEQRIDGATVRRHLLRDSLTGDLAELLFFRTQFPIEEFPLFPVPWLALEPEDRLELARELERIRARPVHVRAIPETATKELLRQIRRGGYVLNVDFKSSKLEDIVSAFESWARREARAHQRKRHSGRASAPQFHKLRWLAAWRLNKASLKQQAAIEFVENHRKRSRSDPTNVLPDYTSPGAWHDALKAAEREIASMQE